MEARIIARGLLAGALGGLVAFLFARVFLEPVIERAIAFEDTMAGMHDHGGGHGVELFSRGVQANVGMGFGVLVFAVAMGALLAVVFCIAHGRFRGLAARPLASLLSAAMLLCAFVIPALKYPPNPPAASLEETLRQRTLLYLLMVVASAVLLVGAVYLGRRLAARLGAWNAALAAAGAYAVAVGVVMVVLPPVDETPEMFPADVLYDFRLYSLGTQAVMWVTIGVVFGELMRRLLDSPTRSRISA